MDKPEVGSLISFTKHPKLHQRHVYLVEKIEDDKIFFTNIESSNTIEEDLESLVSHGMYIHIEH